jgi:hypothetical protein
MGEGHISIRHQKKHKKETWHPDQLLVERNGRVFDNIEQSVPLGVAEIILCEVSLYSQSLQMTS